jgi:hypothetical protein
MRKDGQPYLDGSEKPRPYSDVVAERSEPPMDDKDEAPLCLEPVLSPFANRGRPQR